MAQISDSGLSPWNDTGTFAQYEQQQHTMTNVFMESLKSVSPGSGAYLNEARISSRWFVSFVAYDRTYRRMRSILTGRIRSTEAIIKSCYTSRTLGTLISCCTGPLPLVEIDGSVKMMDDFAAARAQ